VTKAVRVDVIGYAEGADELIHAITETVTGKATAVRCTDEEFHGSPGLGVNGGRSAPPFLANELDELGRVFVHWDDPFVVQLAQRDTNGKALFRFPNQALTPQERQLADS
jgi:hypothetical protein